ISMTKTTASTSRTTKAPTIRIIHRITCLAQFLVCSSLGAARPLRQEVAAPAKEGAASNSRERLSVLRHRTRAHPRHGLTLGPFAQVWRQVSIQKVEIGQHHLAHAFEGLIQGPRPMGAEKKARDLPRGVVERQGFFGPDIGSGAYIAARHRSEQS